MNGWIRLKLPSHDWLSEDTFNVFGHGEKGRNLLFVYTYKRMIQITLSLSIVIKAQRAYFRSLRLFVSLERHTDRKRLFFPGRRSAHFKWTREMKKKLIIPRGKKRSLRYIRDHARKWGWLLLCSSITLRLQLHKRGQESFLPSSENPFPIPPPPSSSESFSGKERRKKNVLLLLWHENLEKSRQASRQATKKRTSKRQNSTHFFQYIYEWRIGWPKITTRLFLSDFHIAVFYIEFRVRGEEEEKGEMIFFSGAKFLECFPSDDQKCLKELRARFFSRDTMTTDRPTFLTTIYHAWKKRSQLFFPSSWPNEQPCSKFRESVSPFSALWFKSVGPNQVRNLSLGQQCQLERGLLRRRDERRKSAWGRKRFGLSMDR